jgi:hypothetical protein
LIAQLAILLKWETGGRRGRTGSRPAYSPARAMRALGRPGEACIIQDVPSA